ncbi:hypothetical protein PPL_08180 [Heterostelium album PN500]|uniref:Transmembrane 9 superfamily member n=1 Tax=Heterostelium pallidum (strain ATCC 26659 / Pp 5 / PN500) TaxID=670386 RepID=D3BIU5_HETP5|nr:hypothetical protein PPL_08180 [Heterostelium album PN500]EFA78719.1 hypothetical protein PPL_08180 [Heterostelium album PN500]|eukprot:XP_020430843.1 hypothetical protein PPL_08180 [Heterostelium album PN500]
MKTYLIVVTIVLVAVLLTYKNKIDHPAKRYAKGDAVPILTNNRLYSRHTLILQDYHILYNQICSNDDDIYNKLVPERCNVDRILTNNEWSVSTIYNITYLNDIKCNVINDNHFKDCTDTHIDNVQLELLKILIENQYLYQLRLDQGIPISNIFKPGYYQHGLKIGSIFKDNNNNNNLYININNHLNINILYSPESNNIVGLEAKAESRRHSMINKGECTLDTKPATLLFSTSSMDSVMRRHPLVWSYSVTFKPVEDVQEYYSFNNNNNIFKALQSNNTTANLYLLLSLSLLSYFVYIIINNLSPSTTTTTNNKKLIATIPNTPLIKSPSYLTLHSMLVGYGAQLLVILLVLLFSSHMTWLSFNSIITIKSGTFSLIQLTSYIAGYYSTSNYLFFNTNNNNNQWIKICLITTLSLPSLLYIILLGNNMILDEYRSTAAMPLLSILKTLGFFIGFYLPVGMLGGYYASKNQYSLLKNYRSSSDSTVQNIKIYISVPRVITYFMKPVVLIPLVALALYWLPNNTQQLFINGDDLGYHSEFTTITVQLALLIVTTILLTIIQTYLSIINKYGNIWWLPMITSSVLLIYQIANIVQNAANYSDLNGTMVIYYTKSILYALFTSITIAYISISTTKWLISNILSNNSK